MIRTMAVIGGLWPTCRCGHIAQDHNEIGECDTAVRAVCPTCSSRLGESRCPCKKYSGPTREQFFDEYLTPEEQEKYRQFFFSQVDIRR